MRKLIPCYIHSFWELNKQWKSNFLLHFMALCTKGLIWCTDPRENSLYCMGVSLIVSSISFHSINVHNSMYYDFAGITSHISFAISKWTKLIKWDHVREYIWFVPYESMMERWIFGGFSFSLSIIHIILLSLSGTYLRLYQRYASVSKRINMKIDNYVKRLPYISINVRDATKLTDA